MTSTIRPRRFITSTQDSYRADVGSAPVPAYAGQLVTGRLGAAHARWNDYLGTAAADDSIALLNSRSLYEIASLDRGRWTIVGIEASLADTSQQVVIYAVDRTVESMSEAAGREEMGVTAFHLGSSTHVDQFLHEAFQRVSIRLVSTLAVDRELRVDGHVELESAEQLSNSHP